MSAVQRVRAALADGRPVIAAAAVQQLLDELDSVRAADPAARVGHIDNREPRKPARQAHPGECATCGHSRAMHDIPEPGPRRWVCEVPDCGCGRTPA